MSKPVAGSAPLRWGTAPLIPADLTAPDTTHMDEGWQAVEEPPHSYFNYWMNLVYLWAVYLDNITAEALTWTALETFNLGIVAANPNGAALSATSTFAVSGADAAMTDYVGTLKGVATISDGGYGAGLFGKGQAGNALSAGVGGLGGAASGISGGGWGGYFFGGPRTTAGALGSAGGGARVWGGSVDGTVNTAVAAGTGLDVHGGDVTSDANGRRGGQGLRVFGGIGQAGYGHAIEVLSGDVNFAGGANTNLTMGAGTTATVESLSVTSNAAVTGTSTITGSLIANGGIVGAATAALQTLTVALTSTFTGLLTALGGISVTGNVNASGTLAGNAVTSTTNITALANVQGVTLTATGQGSSIPMPGTTAVTYLNSWATALGNGVVYWKDAFGMVHLQGQMNTGSAGSIAFNLPAGFRPTGASRLIAVTDAVNAAGIRVTIDTSGNVTLVGTYTTYVSLDNVAFRQ